VTNRLTKLAVFNHDLSFSDLSQQVSGSTGGNGIEPARFGGCNSAEPFVAGSKALIVCKFFIKLQTEI
jgi:hypothetical protein